METSRIVYDRWGEGSPVLLLHGLGHHRRAWRPVAADLAAHHDVIAPDLPGCGESPAPDAQDPYDVDFLVESVLGLCARLGLDRPHLVGNSLGGAVALEMAARGAAASVTAFSPIGFGTAQHSAGARALAAGARWAARVPAPVTRAVARTPPARFLARRALRADSGATGAEPVVFDASVLTPGSPFLRMVPHVADYTFTESVACPVTIAWGDHDRLLPPAGARRALRRIPHARHVALLGCGHIPMADNPRSVAAEILQTCRSTQKAVEVAART